MAGNFKIQKRALTGEFFCFYSHRTQKKKDQEPVDPILYTNPRVVEDWIENKESRAVDHSISDWTAVAPPLGNLMDIGSEIDDFEALDAGN